MKSEFYNDEFSKQDEKLRYHTLALWFIFPAVVSLFIPGIPGIVPVIALSAAVIACAFHIHNYICKLGIRKKRKRLGDKEKGVELVSMGIRYNVRIGILAIATIGGFVGLTQLPMYSASLVSTIVPIILSCIFLSSIITLYRLKNTTLDSNSIENKETAKLTTKFLFGSMFKSLPLYYSTKYFILTLSFRSDVPPDIKLDTDFLDNPPPLYNDIALYKALFSNIISMKFVFAIIDFPLRIMHTSLYVTKSFIDSLMLVDRGNEMLKMDRKEKIIFVLLAPVKMTIEVALQTVGFARFVINETQYNIFHSKYSKYLALIAIVALILFAIAAISVAVASGFVSNIGVFISAIAALFVAIVAVIYVKYTSNSKGAEMNAIPGIELTSIKPSANNSRLLNIENKTGKSPNNTAFSPSQPHNGADSKGKPSSLLTK